MGTWFDMMLANPKVNLSAIRNHYKVKSRFHLVWWWFFPCLALSISLSLCPVFVCVYVRCVYVFMCSYFGCIVIMVAFVLFDRQSFFIHFIFDVGLAHHFSSFFFLYTHRSSLMPIRNVIIGIDDVFVVLVGFLLLLFLLLLAGWLAGCCLIF